MQKVQVRVGHEIALEAPRHRDQTRMRRIQANSRRTQTEENQLLPSCPPVLSTSHTFTHLLQFSLPPPLSSVLRVKHTKVQWLQLPLWLIEMHGSDSLVSPTPERDYKDMLTILSHAGIMTPRSFLVVSKYPDRTPEHLSFPPWHSPHRPP